MTFENPKGVTEKPVKRPQARRPTMTKPNYAQSRKDFEALERIVELDDQVELDADRLYLMREPTYSKAAKMYQAGIRLWFGENPTKNWDGGHDDSTIREIAARHNIKV